MARSNPILAVLALAALALGTGCMDAPRVELHTSHLDQVKPAAPVGHSELKLRVPGAQN